MRFISLALLFLTLLSLQAFSQTGTIKGSVKDAVSGDNVIGANVYIMGTTQGAAVDVDGTYQIDKVKAGSYTLIASFISYETDSIAHITVYPDQTTQVNIAMHETVTNLQSVVVTGRRMTNTDVSVMTEIKKADLVAVGISSQMIKISQDRDAAQVVRRLPGITIVGDHFVNVRGLSERYNTVMLNGILAPSTEVDSKAFAFDLIPSNMINRMMVYKAGSPELPGEFAGAIINIETKNVVEENSTSISVGGGYRFGSTGETFKLGEDKSKTDFLGFGAAERDLPASFPKEDLRGFSQNPNAANQQKLAEATESIPNNWGTRSFTAKPDFKINFNLARTTNIGSKKLDNITSIVYNQSNSGREVDQWRYENAGPRYEYHDHRFSQSNRIGGISNFTFEFNPSNRIEFRNFYNRLSDNTATFRTGQEFLQGVDVVNEGFNYYSRGIYSGQLSGTHALSDALTVNWILGYNNASAAHPDYRQIRSQRALGTQEPFAIVIPPGANNFDAGRLYSNLNENTYTFAGNVQWKLNPEADENKQIKITTGYYLESKERTFRARWMSYKWANFSVIDPTLLYTGFNNLFTEENLGSRFVFEEGTNEGPDNYDNYDGTNALGAGHAGIVLPFGAFRLSTGIRVEYNRLQLYGLDQNKNRLKTSDEALTLPMPFFNLSYNFTDDMLVRLDYSRSVNRPLFRELAPFDYYDFDENYDLQGNPELKTARIHNMDARWEWYPSPSETVTFGAFYKHFKNPIERTLVSSSNIVLQPHNADVANDYGLEAEVRKSFDFSANPIISKFMVVFNAAYIESKIEFPDSKDFETIDKNRALQGQSPYIVNFGLIYNDEDKGFQVNAMYNVFGTRIYAVGDDQNPTIYERPRNVIDLTITKAFGKHLELKGGIQDLLNEQFRLFQDTDHNHKITSVDDKMKGYRSGQLGSFEVGWTF